MPNATASPWIAAWKSFQRRNPTAKGISFPKSFWHYTETTHFSLLLQNRACPLYCVNLWYTLPRESTAAKPWVMAACGNKVMLSLGDVEMKWCNWHSGVSVCYLLYLSCHAKAVAHKASYHSLIERELSSNIVNRVTCLSRFAKNKHSVVFTECIFWIRSIALHNSITVMLLSMKRNKCAHDVQFCSMMV